jgi:hypothetical protein
MAPEQGSGRMETNTPGRHARRRDFERPRKNQLNQKPYAGNDFYIFTATDVKTLNGNRLALP